ncbi:sodium:proton antiporter [Holospora undulata]|uniref:Sodium:proton antiporter n=1 Tax=Holospora undulata HU1 TaxID=1321371 RepID=A0A061JHQ5_9PROT|nr:sodium:proton antiporter [Holospora undulata]ETZ04913.1 hypothetical protein K737_300655 [Holospora undulata HU1]
MQDLLCWGILSSPFCVLLGVMAFLPQLAKKQWECHYQKYILSLVVLTVGAAHFINTKLIINFLEAFYSEYLPFILFLGCLYGFSCGIHVNIFAPPLPKWNTLSLFFGIFTASILGTTGACVIWTHAILQLNLHRRYKVHTMIFLIFCVANVGGIFSSLGDPPLLLGFLKGVPFFWASQHLTRAGLCVSGMLLGVYYLIDKKIYRRENLSLSSPSFSIQVKGWEYIFSLIFLISVVVLIQKYSTQVWKIFSGALVIHSADVYRIFVLGITLCGIQYKRKNLPRFSSHVLKELSWTFFGLFMCVVPVVHWLSTSGACSSIGIQDNPKVLFWTSGFFSSFLDNAPTYVLFVEIAGGFKNITNIQLKHIAFGTVMMGAMTYIGNAPNLLVKSIAEHQGVSMPSYISYMKWSFLILFPILFILIHFIPNS